MVYRLLTHRAASITELKKNPLRTIARAEGEAIAILNRNELAFYCVSPELFAYFQELLEDAKLNDRVNKRKHNAKFVKVDINEL